MTDTQSDAFNEAFEELAGVSLEDIVEVRFTSLPPMKAGFEIEEVKPGTAETKSGDSFTLKVKCRVLEVLSVASADYPDTESQAKLVGKSHVETFFILKSDPLEGLGRLKAYLKDIGAPNPGMSLKELMSGGLNGHKFLGQVKHRKNPNDKDRPFVNLNPIIEKASGQIAV